MKLNITKDSRNDTEDHTGPVFPGAEERKFSYQGERCYCSMRLEIHGYPPARGAGKENHELPEPIHNHYELVINGHTGTALEVKLIGYRSGRNQIEERRANGRAVLSDTLLTSMQFGELCNLIFQKAQVFHETEHFPDSVREVMKKAYPP